jgi:hypothetical protein
MMKMKKWQQKIQKIHVNSTYRCHSSRSTNGVIHVGNQRAPKSLGECILRLYVRDPYPYRSRRGNHVDTGDERHKARPPEDDDVGAVFAKHGDDIVRMSFNLNWKFNASIDGYYDGTI